MESLSGEPASRLTRMPTRARRPPAAQRMADVTTRLLQHQGV